MPETPPPATLAEVQAQLQEAGRLLRQVHHLGPEVQRELAELAEELGHTLDVTALPPQEMAHLADSAAHLIKALHQQQDRGLLAAARARLERAIAGAEAKAPVATGVARRLLDALTNLGI